MNLQSRCQVSVDLASAIAYLHSLPTPIYHRDVKAKHCLLVDGAPMSCKLGDFGLSKLVQQKTWDGRCSSRFCGTPGYIDPAYPRTGRYSDKSDVYSAGVVMLELLTGLRATAVDFVDEVERGRETHGSELHRVLAMDVWPDELAKAWADLALRCCAILPRNRPDSSGLYERLQLLAARAGLPAADAGIAQATDERRAVLLTFSRHGVRLEDALLSSRPALAARARGLPTLQPEWAKGAKVFVEGVGPDNFQTSLRPFHTVIYEDDEGDIMDALKDLPYSVRKLKPDCRDAITWQAPDVDDLVGDEDSANITDITVYSVCLEVKNSFLHVSSRSRADERSTRSA